MDINWLIKQSPLKIHWHEYDTDDEEIFNEAITHCSDEVYNEYMVLSVKKSSNYFRKIRLQKKVINRLKYIYNLRQNRRKYIFNLLKNRLKNKKIILQKKVINRLKNIYNLRQKQRNNIIQKLKQKITIKRLLKNQYIYIYFMKQDIYKLIKTLTVIQKLLILKQNNKKYNDIYDIYEKIYIKVELLIIHLENIEYLDITKYILYIKELYNKIDLVSYIKKNLELIKSHYYFKECIHLCETSLYNITITNTEIVELNPELHSLNNEISCKVNKLNIDLDKKQKLFNHLFFKKINLLYKLEIKDIIYSNKEMDILYIKYCNKLI